MNINGDNTSDNITNGIITNSSTSGSFTIKCDDNTLYDLQTPNNGNNTDVLTTDGVGNTYWAAGGGGGGGSTFQDVYNNSSNPADVVLVNNKPIIFKDTLNQVAFTISSDGINTQAGGVNGGFYNSQMNTIKRADIGDTKIEVIEDIPLTTIRTTFTEDQEFITKKYVDDLPPSNPTFQDVYNASSTPANINILATKPINFLGPTSQVALKILSDLSGFTRVEGNSARFEFVGANSLEPLTGDKIDILGESAVITDRTTFTEDQEFITKKYVDDLPPSNPFNQSLNTGDNVNFNIITSGSFIKTGGTSNQYLMADGSSLQYSQNSGNSNFYLYDSQNGAQSPPVPNGHIEYNNIVQASATFIFISHLTTDGIDIDIFFAQITTIQEVYIQDKNNSLNFIKYNITGTPTLVINDYIAIPVLYTATIPPAQPNGAGTGLTSFGVNHPVIVSFFTNSIEVDTRLTTLETKTQYQTATANTTTFSGVGGIVSNGGFKLNPTTTNFLLANGTSIAQSTITDDSNLQNKAWANYQLNFSQTGLLTSQNGFLPSGAIVAIGATTTAISTNALSIRNKIFKCQNTTSSVADGQRSGYVSSITASTWPVFFGRTGINLNIASGIGDSNTTTNAITQMFQGITNTSFVPSFSSTLGPNTTPSIIGFGHDVGDSVISFYFRGTASGVKIPTTFLASTPSNYWFNFNIYNNCNSDLFTLTLTDIISGLTATQNFTMAISNTAVMSPNDRLFFLSCRGMAVLGGITNSAISQFSKFGLSLK